jgi:hypothetical protein
MKRDLPLSFPAEIAHLKALHEQRLRDRSEELADARYNEHCVYNVASAPDQYTMTCSCVWDRRRGWIKECPEHE